MPLWIKIQLTKLSFCKASLRRMEYFLRLVEKPDPVFRSLRATPVFFCSGRKPFNKSVQYRHGVLPQRSFDGNRRDCSFFRFLGKECDCIGYCFQIELSASMSCSL